MHDNEITLEFIGHYTLQCEDPSHSTLWSHVDSDSSIELAGGLLPLQNDLKLLPLPFYDVAVNLHPAVPIVFLSQPSAKGLQAAGIVASWFGILTDYRPVRFPVTFGSIPQGNAVVISESPTDLPATLSSAGSSGPTVSMKTNPSDPYSKLLVLSGDSPDDLLTAARALTSQRDMLAGESTHVGSLTSLIKREPDDAPRWLPTDKITTIDAIAQQGDLQGDGSVPVGIYSRTPPDLCYDCKAIQNLKFQLNYRYNAIPLANESTLAGVYERRLRELDANAAYGESVTGPADGDSGAGRGHAAIFELDDAEVRVPDCEERAMPGHGAAQPAGIDPQGLVPGHYGHTALGRDAEPRDFCKRRVSVSPEWRTSATLPWCCRIRLPRKRSRCT